MEKPWKDWVDEELANEAQKGLTGQGAQVEMMRRLRDAMLAQLEGSNRPAWVGIGLGVVMAVAAIIQVCLAYKGLGAR